MGKRLVALLLAVVLLLTAGCDNLGAAALSDLRHLLTDADAAVEVGTAGGTLKAAYRAATLMDWSAAYSGVVSERDIAQVVQDVMDKSDPNAPATFQQKMAAVDAMHKVLLTDEGAAILSDCGYRGGGGWTEADLVAYEAVMTACGLR